MTKRVAVNRQPSRAELERLLSADLRSITAHSDRVGRYYARHNDLSHGDFQALLHIMVAETAGTPVTPAQLSQRLDVSAAAITYLADRMIHAGHIRREADPDDRRKSHLRFEQSSLELAHKFFMPLGDHMREAMADLSDRDLRAAPPGVDGDDGRDGDLRKGALRVARADIGAPPQNAGAGGKPLNRSATGWLSHRCRAAT